MSIVALEERIAALPSEPREAAQRIYAVSTSTGTLVPPDAMRPWIEKHFGSVDAVRSQKIVRVTDRFTLEGALFNELRAMRPMAVSEKSGAGSSSSPHHHEKDPPRLFHFPASAQHALTRMERAGAHDRRFARIRPAHRGGAREV